MSLVVNPNNLRPGIVPAKEPPLWSGLIASDIGADILDAEGLELTLDQTVEAIRNSGQNDIIIVVMGHNPSVSSTPKMPIAEALADRISDLNVSFTGLHPIAVNYQKYPIITSPFKGFPMMPWEKLPMNKYRAHNWHCLAGSPRSPYASIYTSLGCPYDCYYCPIHALYGERKVKFRPMADVAAELYILQSVYGVKNLKIWDELFTLKHDRVKQFCNIILANGFDFNIWAYARLDSVDKDILKRMKKAGINWLAYGFESVSDKKFIDKTEDVIKMTRDAGINIIANFMLGAPGMDDDKRSMEFAKKHLFEWVNIYVALPYPGSAWYNDIKPDNKWSDYDQFSDIRSNQRKEYYKDYFTNPDYLTMIKGKFGEQAINQVREMV